MAAKDTQVAGSHYKDMTVQPWEALKAWMTPEEYAGYLRGRAITYLARAPRKGRLTDIKKAHHTLAELIEFLEESQPRS
ncbi:MAG TPA: DUF3310 domain-containing protein [Candidatus Aquilonibacter sp.]|nr:DUF3310 domain-containing protein [Candidatus Aquilonibacter sp.]